ncbi:MAG TPA: 16S rRNA (cytosine(967)-C(5))-methyltransferase RsmB [Kiritimatiellia bacterium]|nr:16S rRNA (cytosine(967)-C(5))-methyltransferase RsmB [Kiritimatiellia bacterium]HRZ13817.1 16S rRNA (cytosine(967)-C(5))-methyltransferase RsmB [Kiritimatiellia bacterium]HSA19438.1 16S rRNA (cytosine(967)-C(5))-methyltransferase RsmB [Kiritimatiellia bacterium]
MPESARERLEAARIIAAWLKTAAFPDRLLDRLSSKRSFIMELAYGVIRGWRALDWIRSQLAPRKPRPQLDALALVGLYQMLFMEGVPEYAAVHETVAAARAAGDARGAGFVNALLRRAQTERASLMALLARQPPGIRLSHPDILLDRWTGRHGGDGAARLCEWNNTPPTTTLRVTDRIAGVPAFLAALDRAGVQAAPHPADPGRFVELPHGFRVAALPGYAEGWFAVQDPSTAMAVDLLAPKPGERVLDACAAPGGKAILVSERMERSGLLVAMDSSADRLKRLRENLARFRDDFARVAEGRADDPALLEKGLPPDARGGFDAILVDAPCTNTGVLRRRPDARWRFTEDRLRGAVRKQRALLNALAGVVAPGGRIVYSTCSLEPEENEEQVRSWLKEHPGLSMEEERALRPPGSRTDGAYAARLVLRC